MKFEIKNEYIANQIKIYLQSFCKGFNEHSGWYESRKGYQKSKHVFILAVRTENNVSFSVYKIRLKIHFEL